MALSVGTETLAASAVGGELKADGAAFFRMQSRHLLKDLLRLEI